jgi:hypothetical protein
MALDSYSFQYRTYFMSLTWCLELLNFWKICGPIFKVPMKGTSHFNQAVRSYLIITQIPIRGENFGLQLKQIFTSEFVLALCDANFAIKTSRTKTVNALSRHWVRHWISTKYHSLSLRDLSVVGIVCHYLQSGRFQWKLTTKVLC